MKIRLLVPVMKNNRIYQRNTVLDVENSEGIRMIHDHIAVPDISMPNKQVIQPPEVRRMWWNVNT